MNTARFAPSAAPPSALLIWVDERNIYVQYPRTDPTSAPYIVTYPKSESGLSKALSILRKSEVAGTTIPAASFNVRAVSSVADRVLRNLGLA